jgi:hypothetical protein
MLEYSDRHRSAVDEGKVKDIETKFRLLVKRRLNKELRDDMSVLSTKEEKKNFLANAYEMELKKMRRLIGSS